VLPVVDRARHDRRHRLPERVAEDRLEVGRAGHAEKAVVNGSVSPSTGRMPTAANPERHTETPVQDGEESLDLPRPVDISL
jgi:hypothetical protein